LLTEVVQKVAQNKATFEANLSFIFNQYQ